MQLAAACISRLRRLLDKRMFRGGGYGHSGMHADAIYAQRYAVSSMLNLQTTQPTTAGAALCLGSSTIY